MVKTYIGSDLIKKVYIGTEKVKKIFIGTEQVYSASHMVTYHIDTSDVVDVEVDDGGDAIASAPTATLSGYTLTGWREDTTASASVLPSKSVTEDGVHLYAVFQKAITLSYNANGGSTTPASQTDNQYYNNGNILNPSFTLAGAISRANSATDASGNEYKYTFNGWNIGAAGTTITISANTTATAQWTSSLYRRWLVKAGIIQSGVQLKVYAGYLSSGSGYVTATSINSGNPNVTCNIQPAVSYPNRTLYVRTSQSYTPANTYLTTIYSWTDNIYGGSGFKSGHWLLSKNGGTIAVATNSLQLRDGANRVGKNICLSYDSSQGSSATPTNIYIFDMYIQ